MRRAEIRGTGPRPDPPAYACEPLPTLRFLLSAFSFTSLPHVPGTVLLRDLVEHRIDQFRRLGFAAVTLRQFDVFVDHDLRRSVGAVEDLVRAQAQDRAI